MISTTIKKVSLRIRKQYFDDIVAGKKKVELRRYSRFWIKRLTQGNPKIAVFVCGKRVHRRYITKIEAGFPEDFLNRELSEQGKKDIGGKNVFCFAIHLGERIGE